MKFTIAFVALFAACVSATPVVESTSEIVPLDNCQGDLGDCYSNGCNPRFNNPSDTIGTCNSGSFQGCPCEKCGGTEGSFRGACTDNGCNGYQGVCTNGNYNGCPCN